MVAECVGDDSQKQDMNNQELVNIGDFQFYFGQLKCCQFSQLKRHRVLSSMGKTVTDLSVHDKIIFLMKDIFCNGNNHALKHVCLVMVYKM